jgi:hypothetical protein
MLYSHVVHEDWREYGSRGKIQYTEYMVYEYRYIAH